MNLILELIILHYVRPWYSMLAFAFIPRKVCQQSYRVIQETSNGGHGGGHYSTGRFLLHTMRCLPVRDIQLEKSILAGNSSYVIKTSILAYDRFQRDYFAPRRPNSRVDDFSYYNTHHWASTARSVLTNNNAIHLNHLTSRHRYWHLCPGQMHILLHPRG